MSKWKNIEHAPKDGTHMLLHGGVLFDGYDYSGEPNNSWVKGFWMDGFGWSTVIALNNEEMCEIKNPTHFMLIANTPA